MNSTLDGSWGTLECPDLSIVIPIFLPGRAPSLFLGHLHAVKYRGVITRLNGRCWDD